MISQTKIRNLFYLLYFSDLVNTLIAYLYYTLSLSSSINQLSFVLIMTILKIVCPALGGFIIDHVQYTLNLLLIGQSLTIVSYMYFLAYCFQELQDYLYFAIGFQILSQQLQTILVFTMVSKHFPVFEIPKQISCFFQFGFLGRFLCFLLIIPVQIMEFKESSDIYTSSKLLQIISGIPGIILVSVTICIWRAYPTFRVDAYEKIPELQLIPVQSKGNLLQALKELLNTDRAVIGIAAGSVMSVITIWQNYQLEKLSFIFHDESNRIEKNPSLYYWGISAIQQIPVVISFILAGCIGKKIQKIEKAIDAMADSSTRVLVLFLLDTLQFTCYKSLLGIRVFVTFVVSIWLQYDYTIIAITSSSLIGVQQQNYRTQGLAFGLLSMFINIFEIWVLSVLSSLKSSDKTYEKLQNAEFTVIYAFAVCFTLIGIIICKMLQFMKQTNKVRDQ